MVLLLASGLSNISQFSPGKELLSVRIAGRVVLNHDLNNFFVYNMSFFCLLFVWFGRIRRYRPTTSPAKNFDGGWYNMVLLVLGLVRLDCYEQKLCLKLSRQSYQTRLCNIRY